MNNSKSYPKFMPIAYDVQQGELYRWCGCGKTKTEPFCDGRDCGKHCTTYRAIVSETVFFCACQKTSSPPFCDGSHSDALLEYVKNNKKF